MASLLVLNLPKEMILPLEGQLGHPALPLLVEVNASDAGCVVPVQLAVFLDFTEHRPVDPSSIKIREVGPVLVVLASTRDRRPVRQPGRPNIANVSAVALALPVVLLALLIGEAEHRQTAEPLPGQILVPYLQTATGLGVPVCSLLRFVSISFPQSHRQRTMGEEWHFLPV